MGIVLLMEVRSILTTPPPRKVQDSEIKAKSSAKRTQVPNQIQECEDGHGKT